MITIVILNSGQKNPQQTQLLLPITQNSRSWFNVYKKAPHDSDLYQKNTQTFMAKEGNTSCRLATD